MQIVIKAHFKAAEQQSIVHEAKLNVLLQDKPHHPGDKLLILIYNVSNNLLRARNHSNQHGEGISDELASLLQDLPGQLNN